LLIRRLPRSPLFPYTTLFRSRRAPVALLPTHLFRSMSFNLTLVLAVNTYAIRQACTYFLTIQLQSYGNSPLHTAILFIPLGVSADRKSTRLNSSHVEISYAVF